MWFKNRRTHKKDKRESSSLNKPSNSTSDISEGGSARSVENRLEKTMKYKKSGGVLNETRTKNKPKLLPGACEEDQAI